MKNKILSFIFAICLVMPCMFIMTACGEKGAPKYNVVLNGNDGASSNTIQVTEGEQVAWPTNPVKENYDFVGWTTDAEGENFWNFKSSVTGNLNLYAQFVEDDVYEYELSTDGNSYIIIGAKAGLTKVVTPLTHLGKPVTEIGDMAFSEYYEDPDLGLSMRGNENITQIILNPSIVKVGEGAFSHCKNVESIFMYDSVTTIETSAFQEIEKLKSLTLSNSLTTLNVMAFTFCTSLEKVAIPESLTYISQRCFNNCTSLKEVVLHDKLTQIKDAAFGECSSLKTITIPSSVTSIGIGALMHTDITSVTLGENVTSLGDYVFWGCDSLTTATINARLTKLPKETFKGCTSLTTVNLPNTIETISQSAFEDCVNLTSLTLPSSCTTISYYAFKNCEKLETFTFNNVLERIDIEAFKGCSFKIESLPSTLSYIGDKAFLTFEQEDVCFEFPSTLRYIGEEVFSSDAMQNFCIDNLPVELKHIGGLSINGSRFGIEINVPSGTETIYEQAFYRAELEDVVLPKGVERIEREAFRYSTICSINIPSTVTYIGPYAFADCPNLTTIIFETDGNVEIDENAFTNSTSLKTLIIPNGTTAIADYAYRNTEFECVIIPSSVQEIGMGAFEECKNLKNVIFLPDENGSMENGVKTIKASAFYGCSSLKSISLPDSVNCVYAGVFKECDALTKVSLGENFELYSDGYTVSFEEVFETNSSLLEIYNKSSLDLSSYVNNETTIRNIYTNVSGASNITTEGQFKFYKDSEVCYLLEYVGVSDSITLPENYNGTNYAIFNYCFAGNNYNENYLDKVVLPSGLTGIGNYAFYEVNLEQSLIIPENIKYIGNYAFYGCNGIPRTLNIPASVTTIGEAAFGCCAVEKVTLPNTITRLENAVFYNCALLTEVELPSNLVYIGEFAFESCVSLSNITLPTSVKHIGAEAFNSCDNLTTLYIPDGIEYVGNNALCVDNLTNVILENNVYYVGSTTNQYVVAAKLNGDEIDLVEINPNCKVTANSFDENTILKKLYLHSNIVGVSGGFYNYLERLFMEHASFPSVSGENVHFNVKELASNDDYEYFITNDDEAVIYSVLLGEETTMNIPSKIGAYPVIELANNMSETAIYLIDEINFISDEGQYYLKRIGKNVFNGSEYQIECLSIPNSVEELGENSLIGINKVFIPNSVQTIENYCTNNVVYCAHPSKPSAWGNDAFGSNAIVVWDIKEIKSNNAYIYAVTNSNTITLVKRLEKNVAYTPATIDGLPVTAIGPNSIDLTGESTSLFVISDGVKTIYDYAFGYCDKIIIPDSVENIGSLYLYANYVFFEGTAETWETFDVEFGGGYVYFYSETEPTDDGNYWHYDADGVTPITMWN